MNITKEHIIAVSESSQGDSPYMYNLRYPIGQYTLSIAVGEAQYCSPREVLADVSEYTTVEVGILKPKGGLMSLDEVINAFGHRIGSLCEGYEYRNDEEAITTCTVLPYIGWDDVEDVASSVWSYNTVMTHPSSTPDWENPLKG